jgi:pentatricopeptide repeat protein
VNAYGRNGNGLAAIELYQEMPSNFPNEISHICVLNACSHSGLLDQARSIFSKMTMKTERITSIMVSLI